MKTKEYRLVTCSSTQDSDVIFSAFRLAASIDLLEATEIVANRLDFAEGHKHYLVVDVSYVRGMTSTAKAYLQNEGGGLKDILGAAIIASNPVSALIANIFIKTPKTFPAKFFANKKDAFNWVNDLKLRASAGRIIHANRSVI